MNGKDMAKVREALKEGIEALKLAEHDYAVQDTMEQALALLDQPQPVADGARELAEKIQDGHLFYDVPRSTGGKAPIMGFCHELNTLEAAALVAQAMREEREKAADIIRDIHPQMNEPEDAYIERLCAAIMGGEGE